MSYYDYDDFESYQYQMEEEIPYLEEPQQDVDTKGEQYIQIIDPSKTEDQGFSFLLQECNIFQMEDSMLNDPNMFYYREARLFNYCANLIQISGVDLFGIQEYVDQLQNLLKFLFQIHEIGQYSDFTPQLAKQYGIQNFKGGHPVGFKINSDSQLVSNLVRIILNQESSETDAYSRIRSYLPRFLVFAINPPKPFVARQGQKILQLQVIQKLQNELFDTTFEKPMKLDLLALSYFSDAKNFAPFKEIVEILSTIFESLLDQRQAEKDIYQKLTNMLQFFLAFTTNQQILQLFLRNNFHKTLYKAIKFTEPLYGCSSQPQWAKEPLVIQAMVNLIVRIVSSDKVDNTFTDMLMDDFNFQLEKQKFDFIYKIILPILNSEQTNLIAVCLHPKQSIEECKRQVDTFLNTQTKTMAASSLLITDMLTFNQGEKLNQLIQESLKKTQPQQKQQQIFQMEDHQFEGMFDDDFDDFTQFKGFTKQKPQPPQNVPPPPNLLPAGWTQPFKIQISQNQFPPFQPLNEPYQQPSLFGSSATNPPLPPQMNAIPPPNPQIQSPQKIQIKQINEIQPYQQFQFSKFSPLPQQPQFLPPPLPQQPQIQPPLQQQPQIQPPLQQQPQIQPPLQQQQQIQPPLQQQQQIQPPLQQQQQIQPPPQQQPQQMQQEVIEQEQVKGSWVQLHVFNPQNPHFSSQILLEILNNKQNALFVFEVMAGDEVVRLACFITHLVQDPKKQNYIQAKSDPQSFFVMMIRDDHFWHVNSYDGRSNILLDIQQQMMQISYYNLPIACINFQDIQQCKFGFPFEKLQNKITLMDQINAAFQQLECFLLSIGIWTFDVNKENSYDGTIMQSLLSNKSYTQQLNYYLSQFRFQTIHFIPNTATNLELQLDSDLKENTINDIEVQEQIQEIKYKNTPFKPLFLKFQQQFQGIQKILQKLCTFLITDKAEQPFKDIIHDLMDLCTYEGYAETLIHTDGFLQLILALTFLNKKQEGKDAYNKAQQIIYEQLAVVLQMQIHYNPLSPQILGQVLNRLDSYLGLLGKQTQQQVFVKFEKPKIQQHKVANFNQPNKPKGIGYGDISYKGQQFIPDQNKQPQQQRQEQKIEVKESQQEVIVQQLSLCLQRLIQMISDYQGLQPLVSEQKLVPFLIKYFDDCNITQLEGQKLFKQIVDIVESLAKNEKTLPIFLGNENCLFRSLEKFNNQILLFIKTFNSNFAEILQFQRMFAYVEHSLYAKDFISISYLSEEKQEQIDANISMHQFYRPFMKKFAVGKCEIKSDNEYLTRMKEYYQQSANPSQAKMQKLVSEISTIEEHLPMESTNSIFIRYDKDRMDCMRTIIFGASGTPYAHGAFLYEMFFGDDYPQRPPKMKLATTGHGKVRFNPNLYNCGKVCLSLLGTWGDNWIANFSTILQILVSVQSMVMSEYVMFNEPGWESQMGTPTGEQANRGYCNFIKVQNIRYAMIEQLQKPPKGFEDVIKKSFYLRKDIICKEIEGWIEQASQPATYSQTQNQCTYQAQPNQYKTDLVKAYEELKIELNKLKFNIGTDFQAAKSNEKLKQIKINPNPFQYQSIVQEYNMPQGLDFQQIDISYDEQIQQRQFDANDQNVQNLLSRYIGVVGLDAVKKQTEATIFIHTLNGLGVEIAKNIILSGVKRVILFDQELVTINDLGTNFYLTEKDLNKRRDESVLSKLKHLNPYVRIDVLKNSLQELNLDEIQVFVTQDPIVAQQASEVQKVAVVLAQTRGVFVRVINDFGQNFTTTDKDGEQLSEVNIESIQGNVVTLFKNQNHNLSDNDLVLIREVQESGFGDSYNKLHQISNVKRTSFTINGQFKEYVSHGIVYQQKQSVQIQFTKIGTVLSQFQYYSENMGMLDRLEEIKRDLVHFCLNFTQNLSKQWNLDTIKNFITLIRQQNLREQLISKYNEDVLYAKQDQLLPIIALLSLNTQFQPLCAFLGGLASQEVLKAINRKYTPIHQNYTQLFEDVLPYNWNDLNFITIGQQNNLEVNQVNYEKFVKKYGLQTQIDRYSDLISIVGNSQQIFNAKVFVIGAGAIGCELLKNYAMLGVGTQGRIYVTDPDMIENSNLSRQFLFREKHIRKPKSLTAAAVVKSMNPNIQISALLEKVCQETNDIFHNQFYKSLKCVTNALDNVQARLFVDSKCIENNISLLESGTLGPKGHVQTIIPNLTESYASKQDPEQNNDIPYCTLRMFPENNIHCLEWARDKFEQYFLRKPQALLQIMQDPQPQQQTIDLAIRVLKKYPNDFDTCVLQARMKFQKLFNTDIEALLKAYPLNAVTKEGKLFWAAPKRPPKPIQFEGQFAFSFVECFAILQAQIYNIEIPKQYDFLQKLASLKINSQNVQKANKIKELVEKQQNNQQIEVEVKNYESLLKEAQQLIKKVNPKIPKPQQFEKDDDDNHHVSFITSATNGRAQNYGIQQVDWMWTKLKAGRIIPAMATTTSCIAALQTLELVKLLQCQSKKYRNTFLNLAIPFMMQSEPGEVEKFKVKSGLEISIWSKIQIKINKQSEPLQYVLKYIEERLDEEVLSLQQGAKVFYVKQMQPKDEEEKYKMLNTPICRLVQFVNGESQINALIQNRQIVVHLT